MGRPRILLDVRFFHNAKVVDLPNRHTLGFIWILCEAKQQDREGVFGSLASLKLSAGPFRDCVPALLEAGLLHAAPAICRRCAERFGALDDKAIVVHDWSDYQQSRTTEWRAEAGLSSGRETLGGKQTGNRVGNKRETLRAREGASPSYSLSDSEERYGVLSRDEPETPVLAYLASVGATVQPNGNGFHRRLVLLVERQGPDAVVAAMKARYAGGDRSDRQLLLGAENELEQIHRPTGKPKGLGPTNEEAERAFGG